jgi:MtN3 and saliva related transmembrane protein
MEAVGFFAGLFTLLTYVPQSVKTIRSRKTRDLSLITLILLSLSALLWVIYGLEKGLKAIWITNSIVALLAFSILAIKLQNKASKK